MGHLGFSSGRLPSLASLIRDHPLHPWLKSSLHPFAGAYVLKGSGQEIGEGGIEGWMLELEAGSRQGGGDSALAGEEGVGEFAEGEFQGEGRGVEKGRAVEGGG